ncbi:MAG: hypothetical protein AABY55_01115 [Candidatus Omnitrophota bacterium]
MNKNKMVLGSAFSADLNTLILQRLIIIAPRITPAERTKTPDKGSIFLSPIFSTIGAIPHTIAASIA